VADNSRFAIARVYRIGDSKGNKQRKHASLWLFQVFALTAGLYGCQVRATSSLTYDTSKITPTHVPHLVLLEKLLGAKKGTDTHCVLRETGQMPIFSIGSVASYVSGTVYSFQTILFLSKLCGLNFFFLTEVDTWTFQVLHSLQDYPASQQFLDAIRSRESINLKQFELTLCEHIIGGWRELDNLTPHETHHSSRIMRTYHTHILLYLWGLLLTGGMTKKEIISLCYLSTFAWMFPAISAVQFLASAFLATTSRLKNARDL